MVPNTDPCDAGVVPNPDPCDAGLVPKLSPPPDGACEGGLVPKLSPPPDGACAGGLVTSPPSVVARGSRADVWAGVGSDSDEFFSGEDITNSYKLKLIDF